MRIQNVIPLYATPATVPPGDTGCPAATGNAATRPATGDNTNCTPAFGHLRAWEGAREV